jgi:protein TonB
MGMKFTLFAIAGLALGTGAPLAGAQPLGPPTDKNSPPPILRTTPGRPEPVQPPPTMDPLKPISKTHTLPPYPPESVAAQEQGSSLMDVHITSAGTVDQCTIVQSSGSDRLDKAACDYVNAVWRWQPPTFHGEPTTVTTRVVIRWDLKNAQVQQ